MQRSRLGAIALSSAALLGAALASPALAATDSEIPTFQEFHASTFKDADQQYIVNGDEPVADTGELREFYDRMVVGPETQIDGLDRQHRRRRRRQVVDLAGRQPDLLRQHQVRPAQDRHRQRDERRRRSVGGARRRRSTSSTCPSQDANCTTRNNNVLFSVEPVQTSQYIARAFFPSSPKRSRNVLVDDSIWTSGSWTPANILGHELGHTLGFRHEHTRPEAGTCFEDNNWRPLTPYDSSSIMHYPQCNGTSSNLSMTATDRQGAATLYGS